MVTCLPHGNLHQFFRIVRASELHVEKKTFRFVQPSNRRYDVDLIALPECKSVIMPTERTRVNTLAHEVAV